MYSFTNEQCRTFAERAIKAEQPIEAMRWYNTAAAATIGHKKTDRYLHDRNEVAKLFNIDVIGDYATDEMCLREVFRIMRDAATKLEPYLEGRIYGRDFKTPLSDEESMICSLIHYASKLPE